MNSRQCILAGNWKLHKTITETRAFFNNFSPALKSERTRLMIAPPFTAIEVAAKLATPQGIAIGAQNCAKHDSGAYTGEVSAEMIKEAGGSFVIVGHSERRHLFQESDETITTKLHKALERGLEVVLCVGETLQEQEAGKAEETLQRQMASVAPLSGAENLIIAYEPVWAIGTGKTATPDYAQQMHAFLRKVLHRHFGEKAESLPIVYGGSVKPNNAQALVSHQDIDGLLIGGASLEADTLSQIIAESEKTLL